MQTLREEFVITKILPHKIWTLSEVKNYLRISYDYDDRLIETLIDGAVIFAENFTSLSLVPKEIKFICGRPGKKEFELKYLPILSLNKITLGQKPLEEKDYYLDKSNGRLNLAYPIAAEMLEAEYNSGFPEGKVPPQIKQGILAHVAQIYDPGESDASEVSLLVRNLYAPYRKYKV